MQACVAVHHLPCWEPDHWDRRIIVAVLPATHIGFERAAAPSGPTGFVSLITDTKPAYIPTRTTDLIMAQ